MRGLIGGDKMNEKEKSKIVDRILEEASQYYEGEGKWYGSYLGVRSESKRYRKGDYLPESRIWDDNWVTNETLDGTSAIGLTDGYKDLTRKQAERAMGLIATYPGNRVYLIAGEQMGW